MKLLILTQKVNKNDQNLGFFHAWIEEFSKHVDRLTVVCLEEGEHDLPQNVQVYSLGKESGTSKFGYVSNFYDYIFSLRKQYDAVFVHMNVEYMILGGLFWKLMKKKVGLWYTHKHVGLRLRLAEKLTDFVMSASKESFRLPSKKLNVMGHGIDTDFFKPTTGAKNERLRVVSVGRLSPSKDYETLLSAIAGLVDAGLDVEVSLVGGPVTKEDISYEKKLKKQAGQGTLKDRVTFHGPVSHEQVPNYLREADLFVNMSNTGSLDKAILEALSMEVLTITCNEGAQGVLGKYAADLMYVRGIPESLSERIRSLTSKSNKEKETLKKELRSEVVKNHSLPLLIKKIRALYETDSSADNLR